MNCMSIGSWLFRLTFHSFDSDLLKLSISEEVKRGETVRARPIQARISQDRTSVNFGLLAIIAGDLMTQRRDTLDLLTAHHFDLLEYGRASLTLYVPRQLEVVK